MLPAPIENARTAATVRVSACAAAGTAMMIALLATAIMSVRMFRISPPYLLVPPTSPGRHKTRRLVDRKP